MTENEPQLLDSINSLTNLLYLHRQNTNSHSKKHPPAFTPSRLLFASVTVEQRCADAGNDFCAGSHKVRDDLYVSLTDKLDDDR